MVKLINTQFKEKIMNNKMDFEFTMEQMEQMAKFVSNLIRECIPFNVKQLNDGFMITLTGGY